MRRHLPIFVLLAAFPCLAAAAGKANPDPKSLEVPADVALEAKALVGKLGSRSFQEREQASRDLQKLGRLALPAIAEAMQTSVNPEVQMRSELLLPAARTDDFRARIDCFLADAEGKYEHNLPGATEFFAVTGRSDAARSLFRDIVLSPNRDLLLAAGKPDELRKAVTERKADFGRANVGAGIVINGVPQTMKVPTIADIAAIYFAESLLTEKQLGGQPGYQATQLLHQPVVKTALTTGPEKDAMLAILGKWCDTREEPMTYYYAMSAFKTLRPPLAVKMAKRLIDAKNGIPTYRGMAIATLGQYAEPDDRDALVALLKDETVITPGIVGGAAKRMPIQGRDVALAMLLVVTKQNPEDYGMTLRFKGNPVNDVQKYNYMAHYFDGDDAEDKRKEAMKKWDDWYAKNKDAVKK